MTNHTLSSAVIFYINPSGRALALTLACYAPCDRAPPEVHPLKMFEILGHPHFQQLHGHKIPMNATNSPDRLNCYILSLSLSYHSLCLFTIYSKNDFWIKLVFTILLIPADSTELPMQRFSSHARVMVVPTFDHPWRHQRSRESCDHHYDAQHIYRIQKSLMPGTMHFSWRPRTLLRTLWWRYWDNNGLLFAFLRMSSSVQVRVVARQTNGASWEVKNDMVLHKICGSHFCPPIFNLTKR